MFFPAVWATVLSVPPILSIRSLHDSFFQYISICLATSLTFRLYLSPYSSPSFHHLHCPLAHAHRPNRRARCVASMPTRSSRSTSPRLAPAPPLPPLRLPTTRRGPGRARRCTRLRRRSCRPLAHRTLATRPRFGRQARRPGSRPAPISTLCFFSRAPRRTMWRPRRPPTRRQCSRRHVSRRGGVFMLECRVQSNKNGNSKES